MKTDKRNKIHIEFLRVIAIFCVFFNHTNELGYTRFANVGDAPTVPILVIISNLSVIAVPLFFMISGALLLGREESITDVYRKRVLRIVLALLLSTFAYRLFLYVLYQNPLNLLYNFAALPFVWGYFSQWYIYSYLAFLVMLPLLRRMVKSMQVKDFIYVFIAHLVYAGMFPILAYVYSKGQFGIIDYFNPAIFMVESIVYSLLGYFVENVIGNKENTEVYNKWFNFRNMWIMIAASVLSLILLKEFVLYKYHTIATLDGNWLSDTQKMLIVVTVVTIYYIAKFLFDRHEVKPAVAKVLKSLGSCVFGVYLFEGILRESTFDLFRKMEPSLGVLPACVVWILIAIAIGFAVVEVLKRIPGLRKIL